MYNIVKKYLALHYHLSLPGIGNFSVETVPAKINIVDRTILPSINKINFSSDNLPSEKKFYSFLSEELNVDETQAVRSFTHFVDDIKSELADKKETVLKGIGKLEQQSNDTINFYADDVVSYFPQLVAERVVRKNTTHTVRVGEQEKSSTEMHETLLLKEDVVYNERWWIPAVILAVIGIAAIAYYYLVLHPAQ